jgi:hypothetical protein
VFLALAPLAVVSRERHLVFKIHPASQVRGIDKQRFLEITPRLFRLAPGGKQDGRGGKQDGRGTPKRRAGTQLFGRMFERFPQCWIAAFDRDFRHTVDRR